MRSASGIAVVLLLIAAPVLLRQVSGQGNLNGEANLHYRRATIASPPTSEPRVFEQHTSAARGSWARKLLNTFFADDHWKASAGDFDWQAYLALNPDLAVRDYGSQEKSWQHYRDHGHREKRLVRLPEVVLQYTAATGLTNQHYCHIAAFSLCAVLAKCSIVLPPALARSSFQDAFSVFRAFNKVEWSAMPLASLYDTDKIIREWAKKGFRVQLTPPLLELPAFEEPDQAFPRYAGEADPRLITNITNLYLKAYDMLELQGIVTQAVVETARRYVRSTGEAEAPYVVVNLPVTLFMLRTNNNLQLVSKVAQKLYFAPVLHRLADKVLRGMAEHAAEFNGAHLRVEADAMDWVRSMGGFAAYWGEFVKAMRTANFGKGTQVYVATGLLTYKAGIGVLGNLTADMMAEGLCNRVTYKEHYLSTAELDALHTEQKALVDLLVLAKADRFVGFEPSTFSFFLSQYRALQGRQPSSSVLVEGKVITTNPLFEAAAVLVDNGFVQQPHGTNHLGTISSS